MTRRQAVVRGVLLSLLLLAYGRGTGLLPGRVQGILYIPANVGLCIGLVWWALRKEGLTWADLGLQRERLGRGLAWGLLVGLGLALPIFLLVLLTAPADPRLENLTGTGVAYAVFLRIPVGTAAFEELAFRGVLQALMVRVLGVGRGLLAAAVVFGLWHIVPTLDLFQAAGLGGQIGGWVYPLYVAALLATFAGGLLFGWLRLRSGHLSAPWLVHTLINSLALAGGYFSQR